MREVSDTIKDKNVENNQVLQSLLEFLKRKDSQTLSDTAHSSQQSTFAEQQQREYFNNLQKSIKDS